MAILSPQQAKLYANKAGFSGQSLDIIVAIAQAESSLNTSAQNRNVDDSVDRGILQINNRWHAEITDACAYDPSCAFSAGWIISKRGTDFTPWSTYTSGAYKRFLGSTGSTSTGKAWFQYPLTHGYITSFQGKGTDTPHFAEDFAAPIDTPFFFLQSGKITIADYQTWGGEVFLQPDSGGPQEYVYHLDLINQNIHPGVHVNSGEIVGYSGGQTSGGHHPTSPRFSTGPHIHFGLFQKYVQTSGSPWFSDMGNEPFGPDPSPLIASYHSGGGGDTTPPPSSQNGFYIGFTNNFQEKFTSVSQKAHDTLVRFPGFTGIAVALDQVEQFPGIIWYGTEESANPLNGVSSAIRSILATIIGNTMPVAVRTLITFCGVLLLIALIWNGLEESSIQDNLTELLIAGGL